MRDATWMYSKSTDISYTCCCRNYGLDRSHCRAAISKGHADLCSCSALRQLHRQWLPLFHWAWWVNRYTGHVWAVRVLTTRVEKGHTSTHTHILSVSCFSHAYPLSRLSTRRMTGDLLTGRCVAESSRPSGGLRSLPLWQCGPLLSAAVSTTALCAATLL